jgi:hypothetical protein
MFADPEFCFSTMLVLRQSLQRFQNRKGVHVRESQGNPTTIFRGELMSVRFLSCVCIICQKTPIHLELLRVEYRFLKAGRVHSKPHTRTCFAIPQTNAAQIAPYLRGHPPLASHGEPLA